MSSVEYEDEKYDYFDDLSNKYEFSSIWSAYEVDNIYDKAFEGENLILQYTHHWGPKTVSRNLPPNPTWLDMWKIADSLINESGDRHHIFIESFEKLTNDTNIIELYTGS